VLITIDPLRCRNIGSSIWIWCFSIGDNDNFNMLFGPLSLNIWISQGIIRQSWNIYADWTCLFIRAIRIWNLKSHIKYWVHAILPEVYYFICSNAVYVIIGSNYWLIIFNSKDFTRYFSWYKWAISRIHGMLVGSRKIGLLNCNPESFDLRLKLLECRLRMSKNRIIQNLWTIAF